jgi:hypothetical protein
MNRELLAIRADLPARDVRAMLRSFGVGAAPVLDPERRPVGVVSLRDELDVDGSAADRMSRPALCVSASTEIEDAARQLARGETHHLIVVDASGAAVGMLSTLDVLRALLDMPVRHPPAFPHWDQTTGVSWSDDWPLETEACVHAPDGPGVIALVTGHRDEIDTLVWAEACVDLRGRARALSTQPKHESPDLERVLALRGLRFRAALVRSESARAHVVALLRERIEHAPPPGGT